MGALETAKVEDTVETISRIADFDRETAKDMYHFSIWVAAVATAGLGFLLTKGLDLVATTPQLKVWIVAAAIGLAFTLALSAIVQWCVGTYRATTQIIKAIYQSQRLQLLEVPETVRALPRSRLATKLVAGEFITEDGLLHRWKRHHRRRDRAQLFYVIAIWVQWVLVLICYVVVFIVAF